MSAIPKKAKISLKNGVYHFPLRLKESVARALVKRADTERRSINAQIEYELNQKPA